MPDQNPAIAERQYLHLGNVVTKVPSWLKHGINGHSLAAIGCTALAYISHPLQHLKP